MKNRILFIDSFSLFHVSDFVIITSSKASGTVAQPQYPLAPVMFMRRASVSPWRLDPSEHHVPGQWSGQHIMWESELDGAHGFQPGAMFLCKWRLQSAEIIIQLLQCSRAD